MSPGWYANAISDINKGLDEALAKFAQRARPKTIRT